MLLRWQADPEIETEHPADRLVKILPQRLRARDAPHDFIHQKAKRARVVALVLSRRPKWPLMLQRSDHRIVIKDRHPLIQRAKARRVRQQMREGHLRLPCPDKLRPHLRHRRAQPQSRLMQRHQTANRRRPLRRRPHRHQRLLRPWPRARPIAKPVRQREHLAPAMPNTHGGTEIAARAEIFLKPRRRGIELVEGRRRAHAEVAAERCNSALTPSRSGSRRA